MFQGLQLSLGISGIFPERNGAGNIIEDQSWKEYREKLEEGKKAQVISSKSYRGSVYVHGPWADMAMKNIFYKRGYEIVDKVEFSDIVVWTGGADINPALYGEKPAGAVGWNDKRDESDVKMITEAGNRFKVGICRGAQLLNCVLNGGTLWQDMDQHGWGSHSVTDLITGQGRTVNSVHHQQMIPNKHGEIIAVTNLATFKDGYNTMWSRQAPGVKEDDDVEAVWYNSTKSLCIQWHPEYGHADSESYFFELMDRYYHAA